MESDTLVARNITVTKGISPGPVNVKTIIVKSSSIHDTSAISNADEQMQALSASISVSHY